MFQLVFIIFVTFIIIFLTIIHKVRLKIFQEEINQKLRIL